MYDPAEDDPREVEAAKYSLNYVPMTGNFSFCFYLFIF